MIFGPSPLIDRNIVSELSAAPGAELQVDALPHLQHGESVVPPENLIRDDARVGVW